MVKYVIILLLSTTGLEEIKLTTYNLDCAALGNAWREANTTYQGSGIQQGNYTSRGKLMVGYYCD